MRSKSTEYTGWGRVLRATSEMMRPERISGLANAMSKTPAPVLGNLRSYGDACLNDDGAAIDATRLDRILSFDAETGIISVEAGMQIGELARIMAPKGWLPPVMPGTGFATIGGAVALDVHGKNHHHAGSFGQHVMSIRLITPSGERIIGPNNNPELFKATVGGLGQTGAIASIELQMLKCKGDVIMVTERRVKDWDDFIDLLDRSDATYSVGWIDATASGDGLGRGILEEAETGAGLVPPPKKSKRVPINAPGFALSNPIVKLFNAAYWRRVPERGRTVVKPINDFFFPLDKIHDWNKLYGKSGFHQFQCVLPLDQAPALRKILGEIVQSGLASPLAVLKRMGPGQAGLMSFPMEGYTLAVDFPNRGRAEAVIKRLEADTLAAGGKIYLAKDALAASDTIHAMYPDRAAWAKAVNDVDPDHAMETDMTRRLKLRAAE